MAPRNRRKANVTSAASHPPAAGASTTNNPPETRRGNPYQYKGSKEGFETKAVEEGLCLRIDMPGAADDGAEVWLEEKELFFSGEAKKQMEFEENRVYGGCIDLTSDPAPISEVKTLMKNGVLRITVVGCSIKPDLSDVSIPSSSTLSDAATRGEWSRLGDYMIKFHSFLLSDTPEGSNGIYPFQLGGPKESVENRVIGCNHLFMRVDMPDVPTHGSTVKVRDDMILFGGDRGKGFEHDEENRGYFGSQRLMCGCCKYVDVTSDVRCGVLRMMVEKKKIKGRVCKCCKK